MIYDAFAQIAPKREIAGTLPRRRPVGNSPASPLRKIFLCQATALQMQQQYRQRCQPFSAATTLHTYAKVAAITPKSLGMHWHTHTHIPTHINAHKSLITNNF